jgi:S1-C subfamily serine protease
VPDDGGDDEQPELGPLLPPDDRLWRHPSEIGGPPAAAGPGGEQESATPRRFPWTISVVSAVAGATAAVGVVLIFSGLSSRSGVDVTASPPPSAEVVGTLPTAFRSGGVAEIADALTPAIAAIEVEDGSTATGVVFRDDGLLLTTAHGLGDREQVTVTLSGGEDVPGEVLGRDPWTDLAVVQVERDGLTSIPLGSSEVVAVGDPAMAMAAPVQGATSPTVTVGVVSALAQRLDPENAPALHGLIRTDTGIGPEATGGALLNRTGALVGIITTFAAEQVVGVGYAVPIDTVREIAGQLAADGRARHVWLGIEGSDLAPEGATQLGLPGGVQVERVAEDSPAAEAGLTAGDVIVAIGTAEVASMSQLVVQLRDQNPGDEVVVAYLRDGLPLTATVTLAERASS